MVQSGDADAFVTIPTPLRSSYTNIAELPFFKSEFIMFTGSENPKIELLKKIKNLVDLKSHGEIMHLILRGGGWHGQHMRGVKQLSEINDSTDILRNLAINRGDVYIEQKTIVLYQINMLGLKNKIHGINTVLDETSWHLCIGKLSSLSDKLPEINNLLHKMQVNGELKFLKEEIFSRYR